MDLTLDFDKLKRISLKLDKTIFVVPEFEGRLYEKDKNMLFKKTVWTSNVSEIPDSEWFKK